MDDLPKHRAINFKSTYNDSSYQHPLFLDKVLSTLSKENIMLFLPGEWYRTDLNTSVVDHFLKEIDIDPFRGGKNTICLVTCDDRLLKRAKYLTLLTGIRVGCLAEQFENDVSSKKSWVSHQKNFQVLFMSPITYLTALRNEYISTKTANIIIVDDCVNIWHYSEVCSIMNDFVKTLPKSERPRVLSMSAHFVYTNFTPIFVPTIPELAALFDATVIVTKESTEPKTYYDITIQQG